MLYGGVKEAKQGDAIFHELLDANRRAVDLAPSLPILLEYATL